MLARGWLDLSLVKRINGIFGISWINHAVAFFGLIHVIPKIPEIRSPKAVHLNSARSHPRKRTDPIAKIPEIRSPKAVHLNSARSHPQKRTDPIPKSCPRPINIANFET
jgi:hypothetical protein